MRYFWLMMAGFTAYGFSLFLSNAILARGVEGETLGILIALIPMVPGFFICGVVVNHIRHMDEMQRKLQFEALALSFAGTALITFSYGFLEGLGYPRMSMFVVWPLMAALWVVGVTIGTLRYR